MGHIAILGAGAWGTAIAQALALHGERIELWTWQAAHAESMARARENVEFFKGFPLAANIHPTADLHAALNGADFCVLVIPSTAFRATLHAAKSAFAEIPLVVATKGIEVDSLMLLSEVIEDVLGGDARARTAILSGPSFAKEVAQQLPTNLVAASTNAELALAVQQRFSTERLRVYSSDDPVGVQVGASLKNVIAIAAGACDGLGFGHNTRAGLITRGLAEIARLAMAKGGSVLTLAGLAGLGDLVLTCTADLSRNRTVGFELGKGKTLDEVLSGLGHVAEGVTTAKSAYDLAQKLNVDLPISTEVYRVLFENKPVKEAVRDVLARPLKPERG
jgi:glycerol-3-phosphate dehydrogenase (NAD(P)+)